LFGVSREEILRGTARLIGAALALSLAAFASTSMPRSCAGIQRA
jgi:hypothetical protein